MTMDFGFNVVSTGKRLSSIDERNSFKVLSGNGRMKVSDNFKRLIGADNHLSYGMQPVFDTETGKIYISVFASVGVVDSEGVTNYPSSSKISKTGEFTDASLSGTIRSLVIDSLNEDEKEEAKDSHFTFLPAVDDDDNLIIVDGEINGQSVKAYVLNYVEMEEKMRKVKEEE